MIQNNVGIESFSKEVECVFKQNSSKQFVFIKKVTELVQTHLERQEDGGVEEVDLPKWSALALQMALLAEGKASEIFQDTFDSKLNVVALATKLYEKAGLYGPPCFLQKAFENFPSEDKKNLSVKLFPLIVENVSESELSDFLRNIKKIPRENRDFILDRFFSMQQQGFQLPTFSFILRFFLSKEMGEFELSAVLDALNALSTEKVDLVLDHLLCLFKRVDEDPSLLSQAIQTFALVPGGEIKEFCQTIAPFFSIKQGLTEVRVEILKNFTALSLRDRKDVRFMTCFFLKNKMTEVDLLNLLVEIASVIESERKNLFKVVSLYSSRVDSSELMVSFWQCAKGIAMQKRTGVFESIGPYVDEYTEVDEIMQMLKTVSLISEEDRSEVFLATRELCLQNLSLSEAWKRVYCFPSNERIVMAQVISRLLGKQKLNRVDFSFLLERMQEISEIYGVEKAFQLENPQELKTILYQTVKAKIERLVNEGDKNNCLASWVMRNKILFSSNSCDALFVLAESLIEKKEFIEWISVDRDSLSDD